MIKIVLKDEDSDSDLWKRDLYLLDIDYIIAENIYEYDIKFAGLNLSKYYELLDKDTLSYLEDLDKDEAHYRIGLLMRDKPGYSKELTKSFAKMRRQFFMANNIKNKNVLSIKKDAVFLVNKTCENTKFGNVEFILKNRYTSFHRFDRYEFYYRNRGNVLAVKGINDKKLQYHEDYMLSFLKDIFNTLETDNNKRVVNKIKKFASLYKSFQLPNGYYRELNSDSLFTLVQEHSNAAIKSEGYIQGFEINHTFNYMTYILRLIQRYFFISGT